MSTQSNLAATRRMIEEVWNEGRFGLLDELVADDFVNHDPADPGDVRGRDAYRARIAMYRTAMPDLKISIEKAFAADEFVAMRWRAEGTNDGELEGLPTTHKRVSVSGMSIGRHDDDGRLLENWDQWDNMGFMAQLGMLPEAAAAGGR